MVADSIHILFAMALVAGLLRARRPTPYLVAALAATVPDIDTFVLSPLRYRDILTSAFWVHRGITHSLTALVMVVVAAWTIGQELPAAIAYGSHLLADTATGSTMLLAPFSPEAYGFHFNWMLGNVVVGLFSIAVLVGWVLVLTLSDPRERVAPSPLTAAYSRLLATVRNW